MSIASYSDLKTAAASWLRRSGNSTYVAQTPDFVTLAEARLNREIGAVEANATRTGTVSSRSLDISALSIAEPLQLWISLSDEDEKELQKRTSMAYSDDNGKPSQWVYESASAIKLDCPCDQAYSFRFRYRQRFALSDSTTTNWLLDNHPDVYLAATLMWGAGYLESWQNGTVFKAILDEGIASIQRQLTASRRGTLRVDPGLHRIGRRSYDDLVNHG